jgi:CheY-like chemotaxis protein
MTPYPEFEHSLPQMAGKILVVDDEPSVVAIAAAVLNTIDITPLKASNGEEAVQVVEREVREGRKVSAVILDLTMPGGMSGFETMEALRELDPDIRVIACSGFFQDGALELCQSIGFNNILPKPYTPDSLLGMIRRTLHEAPSPGSAKAAKSRAAEYFANSSPVAHDTDPSDAPPKKRFSFLTSALANSVRSQPEPFRTTQEPAPSDDLAQK